MGAARAIMFDFNGTLARRAPTARIYQRLFARHGRPLPRGAVFRPARRASEEAIVGIWLGVDGPVLDSLVAERIETYASAAADGSTVTEPVRAAVRYAAARVPVAIVSGAYARRSSPSSRRQGSRAR